MSTLPDSPMMLDSTARAMVAKLESIRLAILNSGGGGGGGGSVKPANYNTSEEKYAGTGKAYIYGDCCSYQDEMYVLTGAAYISANSQNPPAFDLTVWTAFSNIYDLIGINAGLKVFDQYGNIGEVFNDVVNNKATYYAHAEGISTQANGNYSHAEGSNTVANDQSAHAEGDRSVADKSYSHAEGDYTQATGYGGSHSEGSRTLASGSSSHAEGSSSKATSSYTHAEGNTTEANGYNAHSEGRYTKANGMSSHAEGDNTKATGNYSHSEGYYTESKGDYSHAEGGYTKANANYSHAEGYNTQANGDYSRAGIYYSKANAYYSSAVGYYLETNARYEAAFGKYNRSIVDGSTISDYWDTYYSYAVGDRVKVPGDAAKTIYKCIQAIEAPAGTFDPSKWTADGTYDDVNPLIFEVGNGTGNNSRANAFEIYRDNTAKLGGNKIITEIQVPDPPSTDGTYTLQCTVTNGVATYSWV